jgi:hypothetical protein
VKGFRPADGKKANGNVLSVLTYYVLSPSGEEPLYDFALLNNFADGLISGGAFKSTTTKSFRNS